METASQDYSTSCSDKILIGLPCLLLGLGFSVLILKNMPNPMASLDDCGLFLLFSMWDVVATLFVLVGLKKLFGDRPVFAKIIGKSLRRFFLIALAISALTIALFVTTTMIG
jgi:hypothetical protein